jgi:hypothetical protein
VRIWKAIGLLKEAAAGAKTLDLCRRHGLSEQTFYRWEATYGDAVVRCRPSVSCAVMDRSVRRGVSNTDSVMPRER